MSEEQELYAIRADIGFGLDCEAFMRSPVGRYLTTKANADMLTALESLKEVDAENPREIRRLQNEAHCAERFLQWMGEAVTAGEQAQKTFSDN